MPHQRVATVLAGPSVLLREGLAKVLTVAEFDVVASVASVDDLSPDTALQSQPVLLVIDAGDDITTVADQVERFKGDVSNGRVAVLADSERSSSIVSALRAGINAFLVKTAPIDYVIKALELVMLGETILPSAMLPVILANGSGNDPDNVVPPLSSREKYVLDCLLAGDCNKSIARKLGIAESTVKVHVKTILRKIRVRNRTQAAIWAMNNANALPTVAKGRHTLPE